MYLDFLLLGCTWNPVPIGRMYLEPCSYCTDVLGFLIARMYLDFLLHGCTWNPVPIARMYLDNSFFREGPGLDSVRI